MNRKPRIALMSYPMDNRGGKGTALYTRKLIEQLLLDDRFEWFLVHYDRTNDPLYREAHEIVMPSIQLPVGSHFIRQLLFFWKYRNNTFDVIHWFLPRLYPFFWFAPTRYIVVTAHGAGDITAPGVFPFSRRMFNFTLRHFNRFVDACIGVSSFGREEIIEHYGTDPAKTHAIYNGGGEGYRLINKREAQKKIAERYGIRAPYILDISRLDPHKNVPRLIEAYDQARATSRMMHSLVIVGFRGADEQVVLEKMAHSPYAKDIQLIKYVESEDLNALYAGADVFIFPSLNEGFGLPIVESFASGTPVITSNITSMPEIVGNAGVTVDPYDVPAIAAAIERVLSDESLSRSLIQKGIARAKEFTWKQSADRTVALYESLLDA